MWSFVLALATLSSLASGTSPIPGCNEDLALRGLEGASTSTPPSSEFCSGYVVPPASTYTISTITLTLQTTVTTLTTTLGPSSVSTYVETITSTVEHDEFTTVAETTTTTETLVVTSTITEYSTTTFTQVEMEFPQTTIVVTETEVNSSISTQFVNPTR